MPLLDDLGHRNLVEGSFHSSPREQMQTMRSSVLPICERRTEVFRLSISEKPCIFPSRTPRRHLAIRRIIWRITKIAVHCLGQLVAVRKRRTAGAAVAADSSGAAYAGEELESPRSSAGRFLLPRSGVIVCLPKSFGAISFGLQTSSKTTFCFFGRPPRLGDVLLVVPLNCASAPALALGGMP